MNLQDLQKEIPFKWRVQSFSKFKPQATVVAFIDARDVEDLLDEVCGPENWQCEYYQVKNTMCCKIGIAVPITTLHSTSAHDVERVTWVWKSDGGTESDVEKEKGELSDAFKRAAVKWGIGRFLYKLPMKYLPANEAKVDGRTPYVVDHKGERVWDITAHINGGNASTVHPAPVFRAKEVTPPLVNQQTGEVLGEPDPDEMAKLFDGAIIEHDTPELPKQDKAFQACPKCGLKMYYKEGIGKDSGKPYKQWKCEDWMQCKNVEWVK